MAQNPNRLVTKEELLQAVWSDTFVEEGNLTQYISHLRKALGDNSEDTRLIVTIARKGYQFTVDVTVAETAETATQAREEERLKEDGKLEEDAPEYANHRSDSIRHAHCTAGTRDKNVHYGLLFWGFKICSMAVPSFASLVRGIAFPQNYSWRNTFRFHEEDESFAGCGLLALRLANGDRLVALPHCTSDDRMILEILSDAWPVRDSRDTEAIKLGPIPNTRVHENSWCVDRSRGENYFSRCTDCACALILELNSGCCCSFEGDAVDVSPG
jgi:DNA-binding winged helix-turn-helix (wHTH) protein